jgi:hypothetical protein
MDNKNNNENIRELGSAAAGEIHCLTIIGQIEGHQVLPEEQKTTKYEHVMPLLAAVEESPDIKGLLILLNTVGGDVEAGLGIAELIAGMKKPTVSLVLGGGHSIGVPLAVAAKMSMIAPACQRTEKYELSRFLRGELDGGRSPASNEMNSRQSHAEHGFGERSDFFRENTLSQKNRRFELRQRPAAVIRKTSIKAHTSDGSRPWSIPLGTAPGKNSWKQHGLYRLASR